MRQRFCYKNKVPIRADAVLTSVLLSGLQVEGIYRRCGLATKVNRLVDALMTSPSTAPLETDEQGVLDACSALKQYIRRQGSLIPNEKLWLQATGQYTVTVLLLQMLYHGCQCSSIQRIVLSQHACWYYYM